MRVHLAVLLAVCTATARDTSCAMPGNAWEFPPVVVEGAVGPSQPGPAPTASSAAAGAPVTHFCAGYKAGTIQGWKDLRGAASNPDGHVPQDLLEGCPTPTCGSESYQDGYARGRPVGVEWGRAYP